LLPHSIRVTGIHPGLVDTEFLDVRFKGDKKKAAQRIAGLHVLSAADVAETILFALTRPAHVCINELTVMPSAQANTVYIVKD
jgi:NADP-dependent 3-hydroxy acid dehydrogenase YdfG